MCVFVVISGELELICLGPLTNIAMALRLEDGLGAHIKHCYIMGGNTTGNKMKAKRTSKETLRVQQYLTKQHR